mmetsp:Transcript_93256/g.179200  ORF Transcript_93256/g.179200 Transcript_93256/m.179200 type:complete len:961 (+) Transcript_93256:80-2962(+)
MGACPSSDAANERPVRSRPITKKGLTPMVGCLVKTAGTGESCCAVVKRTGFRAQKLFAAGLQSEVPMLPMNVCIIGGGAVGLALALRLAEFPGPVRREVHVTVYDPRWVEADDGKFIWASSGNDKTRSPEQDEIVSVNEEVVNLLCEGSEAALATYAGESVIPGSQNIVLSLLEARLLARVQEDDLRDIITLAIGPPEDVHQSVGQSDLSLPEAAPTTYTSWVEMCAVSHASSGHTLVVAADGEDSVTRKAFNEYFEWSSESTIGKDPQEDSATTEYVLGVTLEEVEVASQSQILSAALSRAQKRYSYTSADRRGYLKIGLTSREYTEVANHFADIRNVIDQAALRGPQVLYSAEADGDLPGLFGKLPFLETIIREGAELFCVKQAPISAIVLSQVVPGSAKVFHCNPPRGVKLCLVGDAAITPSWWPGQSLEVGLKAADALARVLHKGAPLSAYECFMDRVRRRLLLAPVPEIEKDSVNEDAPSRFRTNLKLWRDAIQAISSYNEAAEVEAQNSLALAAHSEAPSADDLSSVREPVVAQEIDLTQFSQVFLENLRPGPPPSSVPDVLPKGAFIAALDAWAQIIGGKPAKALETCSEALDLEPGDRLTMAIRDCSKLQLGLCEEVVNEEIETCDELALWARAEANVYMGQYEQAIEDCTKALFYSPGSVLCFSVRGEAFLRLGLYADAVEDCDATLEREPDSAVALAVRAEAKLNLDRLDEAVMDCDWALHHGETASVLAVRGEAQRRLNKLALAIADCNKALQISPDHFNALSVRGEAYLDLGDLDNALPDLDAAIANARAAAEKSLHGSGGGTGDEALPGSHAAAVSSSTLAATLTARADTLVRLCKYPEAMSDCNEAMEIDPQNSLALAIRAEAQLRRGDPQAALGDCNLALTMERNDAYTYIVRAEAYLCLNRATEAMADCDEALEINPNLDYGVAVRERAALASRQETPPSVSAS